MTCPLYPFPKYYGSSCALLAEVFALAAEEQSHNPGTGCCLCLRNVIYENARFYGCATAAERAMLAFAPTYAEADLLDHPYENDQMKAGEPWWDLGDQVNRIARTEKPGVRMSELRDIASRQICEERQLFLLFISAYFAACEESP